MLHDGPGDPARKGRLSSRKGDGGIRVGAPAIYTFSPIEERWSGSRQPAAPLRLATVPDRFPRAGNAPPGSFALSRGRFASGPIFSCFAALRICCCPRHRESLAARRKGASRGHLSRGKNRPGAGGSGSSSPDRADPLGRPPAKFPQEGGPPPGFPNKPQHPLESPPPGDPVDPRDIVQCFDCPRGERHGQDPPLFPASRLPARSFPSSASRHSVPLSSRSYLPPSGEVKEKPYSIPSERVQHKQHYRTLALSALRMSISFFIMGPRGGGPLGDGSAPRGASRERPAGAVSTGPLRRVNLEGFGRASAGTVQGAPGKPFSGRFAPFFRIPGATYGATSEPLFP